MPGSEENPWLNRFACSTALATLALVGIGGLVTSHGVGMAVPDWPTTYGYNMFFFPISRWADGIFYEHTHRLVASGVGLLTTILALWVFGIKSRPLLRWGGASFLGLGLVCGFLWNDTHHTGLTLAIVGLIARSASFVWPRRQPCAKHLRWLGVLAFLAVVLQGVLGGLRVVLFKDQIGIFHAALAQAFFVLVSMIALFTSGWWCRLAADHAAESAINESSHPNPALVDRRRLRGWLTLATLLVFGQLLLGATMRHQHAGLAIPDFPLAYHKIWPPMDSASVAFYNASRREIGEANPITAVQIALQMAHRLAALLILAAVAVCTATVRRQLGPRHPLARLSLAWLGLILVQASLGAFTIWSNKAADVATAHVVVGALSLMNGALLTLIAFKVLMPARATSPVGIAPSPSGLAPAEPVATSAK